MARRTASVLWMSMVAVNSTILGEALPSQKLGYKVILRPVVQVYSLPATPQASLRSSPCTPWGPNSAGSSRRSSWNSLGRAPSLKRRSQCGERESLLSGEGKGSTDDEAEDGRPGAGAHPEASPGPRATPLRRAESLDHRSTLDLCHTPRPAALLPTKFHDCNGQMVALPSEFFLRIDSHKEDAAEFDDDIEDVSGWGTGDSLSRFHPSLAETKGRVPTRPVVTPSPISVRFPVEGKGVGEPEQVSSLSH